MDSFERKPVKKHLLIRMAFVLFKTFLWLIGLSLLAVASGLCFIYFWNTPDATELIRKPMSQTSILYDRTGTHVLYEVHGDENRKILSHEDIPDSMRQATIAAEDTNFYSHSGLDWRGIGRAVLVDIQARTFQEGGSTITQQLAKNILLSNQKTWERKITEAILAIKIERTYTKDQILDLYLNSVPYGSGAYGIEAAAQIYFGKSAKDLTLDEAALLASLPKATTYYSPYNSHQEDLVARQKWVLGRIHDLGFADQQTITTALGTDTLAKLQAIRHSIVAPHFVFYVLDQLTQQYGRDAVETGGWRITTTLDIDAQAKAEAAVTAGIARNKSRNATNAALTAIDPRTGEILAMVGSRDFFDTSIDGQVNVATSLRQPGSSFKPFAYTEAFQKGFQPETLLYDVPTDFGPDGTGKEYMPNNYDGTFHGLVSMRKALSGSLNIPAVETLYLAGIPETLDLAHRMGITTLNDPNRYGLALVLGGGEVKLIDMTSAFGVFATEGTRHPATGIEKIVDASGSTVWERAQIAGSSVLDPEIARKTVSILSDNNARSYVFGINNPLFIKGHSVAAKTGTTQEFRDAWTVGFTSSLSVGVWTGNNNNAPMVAGSDGIYTAAPIWHDFMISMIGNDPDQPFTPYTPVISDKPLLTGMPSGEIIYYKKGSNKKISAERYANADPSRVKMKIRGDQHSILYYADKNDPLGTTPPNLSDPMLQRWDEAIAANPVDLSGFPIPPPAPTSTDGSEIPMTDPESISFPQ